MSALTTKLQLYKPGGGLSGLITPDEIVDIDRINSNFDLIDANTGFRVVTSGTRPLSPYDGLPILETDTKKIAIWNNTAGQWQNPGSERGASTDYTVADLDGLAGITDAQAGDMVNIRAAFGWTFMRNAGNTNWFPMNPGLFATSGARTTEYAKAAGAYLVAGAVAYMADRNSAPFLYNGTAWQAQQALTPIKPTSVAGTGVTLVGNTVVLTAAATGALANGVFTGDFNAYRILYRIDLGVADGVRGQMSLAGAVDASLVYDLLSAGTTSAGTVGAQVLAANSFGLSASGAGLKHRGEITLFDPAVATPTTGNSKLFSGSSPMIAGGSNSIADNGHVHRTATAYDGFKITTAGGAAATGYMKFFGITDL